jgi:tape measure domain-containing protein
MSFNVKFVYDLVDNLSPKLKAIDRAMSGVANTFSKNATQIASNMSNLSDKAFSFSKSVAVMSTSIGAMGIKAIKSAGDFEALGIQLEILTGSAEKGQKLFKDLSKFAAQTPFELPEVVKGTRTLLGFNIPLSEAMDTIRMLGDVAAGSGADLSQLAVVYGQVAGATKLQGQDAIQFISNSVPILSLLQKTTGKTIEQLKKMGTDGKLSFEMTRKALKQATQQSGMYYQATEKLSQSLNGLFSTLKDSINLAFAELGTEIVKVVDLKNIIKDIVDYAERITQSFKELSPEMKKFIVYGGMFLTALLPIGLALGGFLVALKQIAIVIAFIGRTALLNPFTFWLSAIALLVTNFDTIWSIVKKIFDIIGKITIGAVRMFGRDTAFGKFVNSKLDLFIGKEQNQTTIPIPAQSPQSFSGGFDVNFANMPKNTTVLQRQSTPNFDLGFNTTYAPR